MSFALLIVAAALLRGPPPVSVVKTQVQLRGAVLSAELHRAGGAPAEPLLLARAVWPRSSPAQMLAKKQGKKKMGAAKWTANPPSAPAGATPRVPLANAVPVSPAPAAPQANPVRPAAAPTAVPVVATVPVASLAAPAGPAPMSMATVMPVQGAGPVVAATPVPATSAPEMPRAIAVPMATAVPVVPGSAATGAPWVQAVPVVPAPQPIAATEAAAAAEIAAEMGEAAGGVAASGASGVRGGGGGEFDGEEDEEDDLALELLELVDEIGGRGAAAAPDDVSDVLDIVTDLAEAEPAGLNWDLSPHLAGAWRLRFTNSKAFHLNGGVTGYAKEVTGVQTPELIMKIQTNYRLLTFEEPLEFKQRSLASIVGNLARASSIAAECSWSVGSAGQLLIMANRLVAADRIWEPADKQAKALRVLGACTPAYIDEDLLVLWGQVEGVVFVFEKV